MTSAETDGLLTLTARIVSAYCAHNAVAADALPGLIDRVRAALAVPGSSEPIQDADKPMPAVSPKKSVFPDYIICLEDGRKLKTLKRHLQASYGMTPAQYRERWGLPADYPMVAPSYTERRSALAKTIGLGRKPDAAPVAEAEPTDRHEDSAQGDLVIDGVAVTRLPQRGRKRV